MSTSLPSKGKMIGGVNVTKLMSDLIPPTIAIVIFLAVWEALSQSGITLLDRKSTRLNSSHRNTSRMPSSA